MIGTNVSTFLSTLSLRRATAKQLGLGACQAISIHALLAESDKHIVGTSQVFNNFYPRSPCGERHNINSSVTTADKISIHALLAESDHERSLATLIAFSISIHALLAESDR